MIKKVMIPAGFLAVVIAAVVVYMGLHRNKEAATQINYSGIKDINLENVSPDYWNTDSVHRVAAAEDGYYYITDEDMLVYVDMDSKEEVPVCARPDCAHNSTDCDACLRGCVIYSIYYYNGRLYYMPIEMVWLNCAVRLLMAARVRLLVNYCHAMIQVRFIWDFLAIMYMHMTREHILEVMWNIRSR